jgi:CelD/BcsL family acetyltransferase involved in cellulose biosynthesis
MVDEFRKKTQASLFRSISHLCNLFGSSTINKHRNRLNNLGYKVIKRSDSEWSHAVNEIISSHIKRWASVGIKSQLAEYNHQAFLQRLSGSQIAECWTLTDSNEDFAGGTIVFTWKDRIYYGLSAYNLDYANYSPGTIMLSYLIEEGFNRGFKIFEYGPGNESYKKMWSNHSEYRGAITVYAPSYEL